MWVTLTVIGGMFAMFNLEVWQDIRNAKKGNV